MPILKQKYIIRQNSKQTLDVVFMLLTMPFLWWFLLTRRRILKNSKICILSCDRCGGQIKLWANTFWDFNLLPFNIVNLSSSLCLKLIQLLSTVFSFCIRFMPTYFAFLIDNFNNSNMPPNSQCLVLVYKILYTLYKIQK